MTDERPTIRDVAKRAGTAVSTASLVVNNKGYVSDEVKKRVLEAVEELGYRPNRVARALAKNSTENIGFVVAQEHFSKVEPFYTKVFLGTEFEARQHDYYILLTTVPKSFKPSCIPRFIRECSVDGVIFAGKLSEGYVRAALNNDIAAVVIDYRYPRSKVPTVNIDNLQGSALAVEHLIKLGHENIAFVGGDLQHPSISQRFEGYRRTLEANGLKYTEKLVSVDEPGTGPDDGYNATMKLLKSKTKFTAIVACNDAVAIGSMRALKEYNIEVPTNVSIVGFDDIELSSHIDPELTTLRVQKEELGATALRILAQSLKSEKRIISSTLIEPELVVRESTAKPYT
ncbi:MAG: LacI family DNA-binding transcriptional regulator [Candidatus Kryptoniota bacterium]